MVGVVVVVLYVICHVLCPMFLMLLQVSNSAATIHAAIESITITDVGKVVLTFEEL